MTTTTSPAPTKPRKSSVHEAAPGLLILALHERADLLHRIAEQPPQLIGGAIPKLTVLKAAELLMRLEKLCDGIEGISDELWQLAGRPG